MSRLPIARRRRRCCRFVARERSGQRAIQGSPGRICRDDRHGKRFRRQSIRKWVGHLNNDVQNFGCEDPHAAVLTHSGVHAVQDRYPSFLKEQVVLPHLPLNLRGGRFSRFQPLLKNRFSSQDQIRFSILGLCCNTQLCLMFMFCSQNNLVCFDCIHTCFRKESSVCSVKLLAKCLSDRLSRCCV